MHHSYSSSLSPFQAKTGTPRAAIAAAVWSWVEKMLHELQLSVVIGPFPACGAEHGSAATGRLDDEGIGKREELLTEGGEFGVDYGPQGGQMVLDRNPHVIRFDTFVVAAVHVAGSRHLFPRNRWMPRLQVYRQAA